VGGEEDRFAVTIAAAEDVACGILGYFEPEVAETAFELRCDGVLFARGGVDGDEFEEGLDDAIAVDHGALLRRGVGEGYRSITLRTPPAGDDGKASTRQSQASAK
jgi:hypothetical protein